MYWLGGKECERKEKEINKKKIMAMRWLCAYNFGKIEQNLGSAEICRVCTGYAKKISGQKREKRKLAVCWLRLFFRQ